MFAFLFRYELAYRDMTARIVRQTNVVPIEIYQKHQLSLRSQQEAAVFLPRMNETKRDVA